MTKFYVKAQNDDGIMLTKRIYRQHPEDDINNKYIAMYINIYKPD